MEPLKKKEDRLDIIGKLEFAKEAMKNDDYLFVSDLLDEIMSMVSVYREDWNDELGQEFLDEQKVDQFLDEELTKEMRNKQ